MPRPIAVDARSDYRLWLRFDDGIEGEVDLSDLGGRGVFASWRDPGVFRAVHISEYGAIAWSDEVDLCADNLYERLSGTPAHAAQ